MISLSNATTTGIRHRPIAARICRASRGNIRLLRNNSSRTTPPGRRSPTTPACRSGSARSSPVTRSVGRDFDLTDTFNNQAPQKTNLAVSMHYAYARSWSSARTSGTRTTTTVCRLSRFDLWPRLLVKPTSRQPLPTMSAGSSVHPTVQLNTARHCRSGASTRPATSRVIRRSWHRCRPAAFRILNQLFLDSGSTQRQIVIDALIQNQGCQRTQVRSTAHSADRSQKRERHTRLARSAQLHI